MVACRGGLCITFFSFGSLTVSASSVRAFRIWAAATLVEAFSKAFVKPISTIVNFWGFQTADNNFLLKCSKSNWNQEQDK